MLPDWSIVQISPLAMIAGPPEPVEVVHSCRKLGGDAFTLIAVTPPPQGTYTVDPLYASPPSGSPPQTCVIWYWWPIPPRVVRLTRYPFWDLLAVKARFPISATVPAKSASLALSCP